MPKTNKDFGPRWLATNPQGFVMCAHSWDDADELERGIISKGELSKRNLAIEARGLAEFYANHK